MTGLLNLGVGRDGVCPSGPSVFKFPTLKMLCLPAKTGALPLPHVWKRTKTRQLSIAWVVFPFVTSNIDTVFQHYCLSDMQDKKVSLIPSDVPNVLHVCKVNFACSGLKPL